jgi:hypothetical protein
LVLRQQINVLSRKSPKRPALNNADRLLFVWLSRLVPTTLAALAVVSPETVIRWHRAGFRAYWRLRSRPLLSCLPQHIWARAQNTGPVLVGRLADGSVRSCAAS